MEQNMRFGLILGQLGILKKEWANQEKLLRAVFSCFTGQNLFLKIRKIYCSVHTKKVA